MPRGRAWGAPGAADACVPLFEKVFTDRQFDQYSDFVKKETSAGKKAETPAALKTVYRDWRTYQFSDHYPMWVRLVTDGSAPYLDRIANGEGG